MTLNRVFLPATDAVSRAVNNLSMSADNEFRSLAARVSELEKKETPYTNHHIHSYATAQTFVTSASYTMLCDLPVDLTKGDGDHYTVIAVVDCEFPASGVFALRLTDGTDILYEAIDLERVGHGGEVLMGVHKPNQGKSLTYKVEAKRASGTGDMTYVSHSMIAIRGYA